MDKEQQKKHIIDMMEKDQELGLYDIFNDEKRQGVKDLIDTHKQETTGKEFYESADAVVTVYRPETLEEAELKTMLKEATNQTTCASERMGFVLGAKWQAERMYSEEDMIEFAVWMYLEVGQNSGKERTNKELFKEWFEQFKKK